MKKQTVYSLTEETKRDIKVLSAVAGITASAMLEIIVREYIKFEEEKKARMDSYKLQPVIPIPDHGDFVIV